MSESMLADKERAALAQIAEFATERQSDAPGDGKALSRLHSRLAALRRELAWDALVEICAGHRPFTITFDQSEHCAEAFAEMVSLSCCEFDVCDEEHRECITNLIAAAGVTGDCGDWEQEFAIRVDDLLDAHAGSDMLCGRDPFVFAANQQRFVRFAEGDLTPAMWLKEGMTAAEYIKICWNTSNNRPMPLADLSELISHSSPDQLTEALEMIDTNGIQLDEGVRDVLCASIARRAARLNQRRSGQRPGM